MALTWPIDEHTTFQCEWDSPNPVCKVTGRAITLHGNAYVDVANQRLVLDGVGDYATVDPAGAPMFDLAANHTAELFLKMGSSQVGGVIGRGPNAVAYRWVAWASGSNSGALELYFNNALPVGYAASGINDNNLNHIAYVRSTTSSTQKTFKNGVQRVTYDLASVPASSSAALLYIGADLADLANRDIAGEVGPIRISKVDRYAAAFEPPVPGAYVEPTPGYKGIFSGTRRIASILKGSTAIARAYKGEHLVFDTAASVESHLYWRILYLGTDISNRNAAEVEFRGERGGANLAVGGVPSVSSIVSGSAANLFDGNGTTAWRSTNTNGPRWVKYQFPAPVDIKSVAIMPDRLVASFCIMTNFAVQWSDDDVNWTTAWSVSGFSAGGSLRLTEFSDPLRDPTPLPVSGYRFWRINASATTLGIASGIKFREMAFREVAGGAHAVGSGGGAFAPRENTISTMAPNAFDNNTGNEFYSGTGGLIGFDFGPGVGKNIVQFAGYHTQANTSPTHFTIEASNDGINWTVMKTVSGYTWTLNTWNAFDIP